MTDRQQNPSWRRHKRPQSMVAQQFSAALDDLFRMDDGLDTIVQTVEEKRKSVFQQNQELEELQARLRAAEARLKAAGSEEASPASSAANSPDRTAAKAIFSTMETARMPQEPGAEKNETRSPTSTTSGEFVVVERPKSARPIPRTRLRTPEIMEESSEEEDEESSEEGEEGEEEEDAEEEDEEEDSSEETSSGSEESDES